MKQRGEAVFPFFKDKERRELSSVEAVDEIERLVYAYLKPLGFRKLGRTLHRFVDGDTLPKWSISKMAARRNRYTVFCG